MRTSCLAALLVLLLVPCAALAAEEKKPKRPKPKTLAEMEQRLTALAKRISKLVEVANKDPDERKIEIYQGYTPKELKKTRGRYRAEDVLGWMVAPDKNFNVRKKAQKALEDARFRGDPDLSDSEKQGPRTKRAYFCRERVAKYLRAEDRFARELANQLLNAFYSDGRRSYPEIRAYKADVESTWKSAYTKWRQFLNRR